MEGRREGNETQHQQQRKKPKVFKKQKQGTESHMNSARTCFVIHEKDRDETRPG